MIKHKKGTQPVHPDAKPLKISIDAAKYHGYEQNWTGIEVNDNNRCVFSIATFNWYNYHFSAKDSQNFLVEYLNLNGKPDKAKLFKKSSELSFPRSMGWLARMTLMGWPISEEEENRLNEAVENSIATVQVSTEEVVETKPKVNIQEILKEKVAEAGGEIEGLIDEYIIGGCKLKHKFSPVDVLKTLNVSPLHVKSEIDHFLQVREEFNLAYQGKGDYKEAYDHLSKIQLRNIVKFIDLIISDYNNYIALKKANKKPRKRKVKTPAEIAKKLKFMEEFSDLNLRSMRPENIVGAKELFAYDSKKRKLMYFIADDYAGKLSIKNSTIDGFDVNKSTQKTIRKPENFFKDFMDASKPDTRKIFKLIKSAEQKISGRFNDNILILKVW